MGFPSYLFLVFFSVMGLFTDESDPDQRLILACHRVDLEEVIHALQSGADINASFGEGDRKLFRDPWSLGWPLEVSHWTPLIALANSSSTPPPPRPIKNTEEDLAWAQTQQQALPASVIEQREEVELQIAAILISHNARINEYERLGTTALYDAVRNRKLALSKFLLRFKANVRTQTFASYNGSGGTSPLHCSFWSEELTALLLQHGADPEVRDQSGRTPLDFVKHPAVRKLYTTP